MFNFKMFCLMKKHVFSLMMMLALVVLAGTSAMAQLQDAADNGSGARFYMIAGSSHTFAITQTEAGSNIAWTLVEEAGQTVSGTKTPGGANGETYTIVWDQNASGSYYIQVVETRAAAGIGADCALTTRRFYVSLIDFDVWVYVSDINGNQITTATLLATCGDGTIENYANDPDGLAFSNIFNGDGNLATYKGLAADDNDLGTPAGTPASTRRYVTFGIIWDSNLPAAEATAFAAAVDAIHFDYISTVSEGLIDVNGNVLATSADEVSSNKQASTPAILTAEHANAIAFTIEMNFDDYWLGASHSDITYNLSASNVTIYDGTSILGVEPDNKESATASDFPASAATAANITETGTILLAPATTTIGVSQN